MKTHKAWRTWMVILAMGIVGMVLSMQIQKFYPALAASIATAVVIGVALEFLLPPRKRLDRVVGAALGCLFGFLLGRLIGAQLLWPSALLGAALLLNMFPEQPAKEAELPHLPGLADKKTATSH